MDDPPDPRCPPPGNVPENHCRTQRTHLSAEALSSVEGAKEETHPAGNLNGNNLGLSHYLTCQFYVQKQPVSPISTAQYPATPTKPGCCRVECTKPISQSPNAQSPLPDSERCPVSIRYETSANIKICLRNESSALTRQF